MTDATGDRPGKNAPRGAKGPDELRRQIAETRTRLGATVEELAAKADVRARARTRAADLRDKAGAMTVQLRSTAAQAGHTVHDRATKAGHTVQRAGHTVQERAGEAAHTARRRASHTGRELTDRASGAQDAVHDTARQAGGRIEQRAPRPVRAAVHAGRRHPGLVAGCAAGLAAYGAWRILRHPR
ncbi:DUF3618 domain-containing protein [Streptomyces sp. NPDC057386]|uniref:DUF3618 domain-containing protein n=1 Tax=Streptomyces thermocoprophilus TaxID=78356 RepID=A0ABV5VLU5_9ACTN